LNLKKHKTLKTNRKTQQNAKCKTAALTLKKKRDDVSIWLIMHKSANICS